MKKPSANFIAWGIVAGVLIGTAVFLGTTLGQSQSSNTTAGDSTFKAAGDVIDVSDDALVPAGIKVEKAAVSDVPRTLTLTGKSGLDMDHVTHVSALFGGKVTDITPDAELGKTVLGPDASGGPTKLCIIESNDLAQAKANWLQGLIQVKIDEQGLSRAQELYKANVLSEKSLYDAESQLLKDQSAQEAARQQLLIFGLKDSEIDGIRKQAVLAGVQQPGNPNTDPAKAARTTEQIQRERMGYVLTAPRSGVIAEKFVAGGEVAIPQNNLFTIADTKRLWIWGDVYERDLDKVKPGQRIKAYFTSEPDRARDVSVEWVSPVLDPNTHSIKIRGSLDNSDGHILSDMYATLVVTIGDGKNSLVVPATAVMREDENAWVFVQVGQGNGRTQFKRTPVKIESVDEGFGSTAGSSTASAAAGSASRNNGQEGSSGRVRIASGIVPGDMIVVDGGIGLFNEMKEQSENQPAPAAADKSAPDKSAPDKPAGAT